MRCHLTLGCNVAAMATFVVIVRTVDPVNSLPTTSAHGPFPDRAAADKLRDQVNEQQQAYNAETVQVKAKTLRSVASIHGGA